MNKVMLMGRLTRNPEIRNIPEKNLTVTHYTLATDRKGRKDSSSGEQTADFIPCVSFGKAAEFAEKYFTKGMRVAVVGRIQTGSYKNKEGQNVYRTEIIVDEQYFADSKSGSGSYGGSENLSNIRNEEAVAEQSVGFMPIPEEAEDDLPFA